MMRTRDRGMMKRDAPVFARPVRVADIPDDGMELSIEADRADCSWIADALDLPSVAALSARYRLFRRPGGRVQVTGDVMARVTQMCVVSLEPFESEVVNAVDLVFAPVEPSGSGPRSIGQGRGGRKSASSCREIAPPAGESDESDPPDPIIDDRIDLGAVAVEFLALALDPYPKKPGVAFSDVVVGEINEPASSAFAVLERFKDRGRT